MKAKQLFFAAALGATTVAPGVTGMFDVALAQDATSGAIQGVVKDESTGEALPGVTVVIAGPSSQPQTTITDENGFYKVTSLPPGVGYIVTFYFADIVLERQGITVGVNKTAPVYVKMKTDAAGGETIIVVDSVPTIDPTSTTQGITLDSAYLDKIPVPGRSFESALGAAAGSQSDGLGVAFSGSTSLENQYYVDGVNTTGLSYGNSGSSVINNFIEEIEVITGGYNAEYGRATGGVINVVTKTGSNDVHGSAWFNIAPGQVRAERDRTPVQFSSIDATTNPDYDLDFGLEIGGPIIKDRAWFWIGASPRLQSSTTTRITKRRTDCRRVDPVTGALSTPIGQECPEDDRRLMSSGGYADGVHDRDPETGFLIYEDLDRAFVNQGFRNAQVLGKINFAATPEHQGQVSAHFTPYDLDQTRTYAKMDEQAVTAEGYNLDTSAKWTSKFNDNKTEVEAVIGLHRATTVAGSPGGTRDHLEFQRLRLGNLGTWSRLGGESQATAEGCADNSPGGGGDPYPFITNCPDEGIGYAIGGPGGLADDVERRIQGRVGVIQRVRALGTHEVKAGIDMEDNQLDKSRQLSGDAFIDNTLGNWVRVFRYVQLGPAEDANRDLYPDRCVSRACRFLRASDPESIVKGETVNWSAYLRDSWQVRPNFTLNYGLRYEEQRLRYGEHLRNQVDPLTGDYRGLNAMTMRGMWAPRLGVLYDWTKEGRSKIYSHWGRFYESIPMDINDRSFGGEVFYDQYFDPRQCAAKMDNGDPDDAQVALENSTLGGPDGVRCARLHQTDPLERASVGEDLIGSGTLVAPGIKPQYMDELIFGLEFEVVDDLKLGVAYQNRRMGRVIEDISTDGAQTYVIANPGEWSAEEERKLLDQIDRTDDMDERGRLRNQLEMFRGIRTFDKPQRDYNALQFTATRRFSRAMYMQASYTYARTRGNYVGLFSPENGQVDPNITSAYDLIELLANRNGPLPQDRPHYIKLDGYYTFDFKKAGEATAGIRFRALSGTPVNVLGRHHLYGTSESFILPRGTVARTDFETGLDLHLDYTRELARGIKIQLFTDLFNVFNDQGTFAVDQDYTYLSNVNPIVGGTYDDLIWAKELDRNGAETTNSIRRNPNFGNTSVRYSPFFARFGAKVIF
jgi:outer membrane receptor protein involved in Fe transport